MEHRTIRAVLDQAIAEEAHAADWYREMADRADSEELRRFLMSLVADEEVHRDTLERVREGDLSVFDAKWPSHDSLLENAEEHTGQPGSVREAMLRAIEGERRAFLLYKELAMQAVDPGIQKLLESLAKQEADHWAALDEKYAKELHG